MVWSRSGLALDLDLVWVSLRLDYCKALYVRLDQTSVHRLQMVQSAAARLLTGTKKHEHITPVRTTLHWLSAVTGSIFKCYSYILSPYGLAPSYLSELLTKYSPTRSQRSTSCCCWTFLGQNKKFKEMGPFQWQAPDWQTLTHPSSRVLWALQIPFKGTPICTGFQHKWSFSFYFAKCGAQWSSGRPITGRLAV